MPAVALPSTRFSCLKAAQEGESVRRIAITVKRCRFPARLRRGRCFVGKARGPANLDDADLLLELAELSGLAGLEDTDATLEIGEGAADNSEDGSGATLAATSRPASEWNPADGPDLNGPWPPWDADAIETVPEPQPEPREPVKELTDWEKQAKEWKAEFKHKQEQEHKAAMAKVGQYKYVSMVTDVRLERRWGPRKDWTDDQILAWINPIPDVPLFVLNPNGRVDFAHLPELSEEIEDWITRHGRWLEEDTLSLADRARKEREMADDFEDFDPARGKLAAESAVDIGDESLDDVDESLEESTLDDPLDTLDEPGFPI